MSGGGADQDFLGLAQQNGVLAGTELALVLVPALEHKTGVGVADGLGSLVGTLPNGIAGGLAVTVEDDAQHRIAQVSEAYRP